MTEYTSQCPEAAGLDTAQFAIDQHRPLLQNPDQSLGAIAITRDCLAKLRSELPCTGPRLNQNGQFVCPLSAVLQIAVNRAVNPLSANGIRLPDLPSTPTPYSPPIVQGGPYL